MTEFSNEEKLHHYMGIEMNMQTWNLLGEKDRTEQDDTRMLNFAKASLYHWKKSPKFEPVNGQRGEWMISHVYAILGRGKEALESAQKTMRLTKQHNFSLISTASRKGEFPSRFTQSSGSKPSGIFTINGESPARSNT